MVRTKNRYLLLEINPVTPDTNVASFHVTNQEFLAAIEKKVKRLYGDFGIATLLYPNMVVKYCNPHLRIAIIRVRHGPHRFVSSALPFIRKLVNTCIEVQLLYTAGSMRTCSKFLKRYQVRRIYEDLEQFRGRPEYAKMYQDFVSPINPSI